MSNPKFSVVVPVYNVRDYLPECLDSLLGQTFKNFEVVLVDDGSTDGSGQICDSYAEKYSFISVVHQENRGLSGARNTGISRCLGEYLFFLDSDDLLYDSMALATLNEYCSPGGGE